MDSLQEKVYDMVKSGHNVLVLGQAGTGKTFLMKNISGLLKNAGYNVAVTATTGIASTHLPNSTTLHKWAGLEDGRHSTSELIYLLKNDERFQLAKDRIISTHILIIDEVSMLSERTMSKLENICRALKKPDMLFGGLQVVLSGDIFQLPPVANELYGDHGKYFFEYKYFDEIFPHVLTLGNVYRQKEVERGDNISDSTISILEGLHQQINEDDCVHLFGTNFEVDVFNHDKLSCLPGQMHVIKSIDSGDKYYLSRLTAPPTLGLKEGCKVMLLVNLTDRLVNGVQGRVKDVKNDCVHVIFDVDGGKITVPIHRYSFTTYDPVSKNILAQRRQIPLKLCYGMTVHKSQGLTMKNVVVHCAHISKPGQLGVAVGRVESLEGLQIKDFKRSCITYHRQVIYSFYRGAGIGNEDENLKCCRKYCKEYEDISETKTANEFVNENDETYEHVLKTDDDDIDDEFSDIEDEVLQIIDEMDCTETQEHTDKINKFISKVVDTYKVTPCESKAESFKKVILQQMSQFREWFDKQFLNINQILCAIIPDPNSKVEPKHFRQFYTDFQRYMNDESFTFSSENLLSKMNVNHSDFHTQFLVSIVFEIQRNLIESMSERTKCEAPPPLNEIAEENISPAGRGKIRYVGGYTLAKITHQESNFVRSCLFKEERQIELKQHLLNIKILEQMHARYEDLHDTSDPDSLQETKRKQNIRQSLTYTTDKFFLFIQVMEGKCRNLLTHSNLVKYDKDIYSALVQNIYCVIRK